MLDNASRSGAKALPVVIYGLFAYLAFQVSFVYLALFLANLWVPYTVDAGRSSSPGLAVAINVGLLLLFGIQHSVMPRASFKRWYYRHLPRATERSTYVAASSLALLLTCWFWQPLGAETVLWQLTGPAQVAAWVLFAAGFGLLFASSFMLSHTELTGLQQVFDHFRGRQPRQQEFRTPGVYRFVRHPIQTGVLIAFWATPTMTVSHLVFALGMTLYVLIGLYFEEKDLVRAFGERYLNYRLQVPKLWPRLVPRLGQRPVPSRQS